MLPPSEFRQAVTDPETEKNPLWQLRRLILKVLELQHRKRHAFEMVQKQDNDIDYFTNMAKLGIFKHDYDLVILYAILHAPCLDSTSPGAKQEPNRTLLGNSKTVHMAKDCHHDPALVESGGFRPGDEVLASASAANRAPLSDWSVPV